MCLVVRAEGANACSRGRRLVVQTGASVKKSSGAIHGIPR
jgi:hypothetical protein